MADRARWLLLTHQGRMVLVALYLTAGAVSVVTYAVMRGPLYALGQAAVLAFGLFWVRWCLQRPWPGQGRWE
ncbi:MAG TPA: hypothetical protein VN636_17095 [Acidimicrobiia bacterium]|nr:hypothetical protein [Acidimicrobiia bacterium]